MSTLSAVASPRRGITPAQVIILAGGCGVVMAFMALATWGGMGVVALALMLCALVAVLIVARPEFGVIALTSTFFLSYPAALQGSGPLTINNVLGLMLAGILLIRVTLQRRLDFFETGAMRLVLLITALFIINVAITDQTPSFTYMSVLDLTNERTHQTIVDLAFLIFIVAFLRQRWHIIVLAATVVLFVVVTAPNAIWNALAATGQIEQVRAAADFGIKSAANANRLAFMCGIAITLVAFAATATRSRRARALAALVVLLLIATIFLSASRSGLINLVVIGFLFAARLRIRPFRTAAIGLFVIALLSAVLLLAPAELLATMAGQQPGVIVQLDKHAKDHGGFLEKYASRLTAFTTSDDEGAGATGSTKARLKLLALGAHMAWDHPLMGVGMGDFRWVSIMDYANPQVAAMHNSYMLTLVEGGLVLLTPYLVLFVVTWLMIKRTRRAAAARPDIPLDWLVDATRTMLLIFVIFSVFAEMWHDVYLYLILGFAIVLERLYRPAPPSIASDTSVSTA